MKKFKIVITHNKTEFYSYYLNAYDEQKAIDKARLDLPYIMAAKKINFPLDELEINTIEQDIENVEEDEGSYGAGVCLSLFLNLIGLIIALCVGKGKTKIGALVMVLIEFFIAIVLLLVFGL